MQQAKHPAVYLILGGVRSGKSRFAIGLADHLRDVTFIATGCASDEEMRTRIDTHRAERRAEWTTVEEPLDLPAALRSLSASCELAIIDCLTFYAANLMEHSAGEDSRAAVTALCAALTETRCPVVLVSNEVGSGVVPPYEAGRRFRDLLGEINQAVASVASDVVLLVAGLPLPLKQNGRPTAPDLRQSLPQGAQS